jgi:hypothetical protein
MRIVATVDGEAQAELLCTRLSNVGIRALHKRNIGMDLPQFGAGGARDVYVDDHDLERAQELLQGGDLSDDELGDVSEEAFRKITGHEPPGDG